MKSCSHCGRWKADAEFYPDRRGRSADGLHHACIDCERTAARDRMRAAYRSKRGFPVDAPLWKLRGRDERGLFARGGA